MLSIGEEDTALMKAIESGDTDLVYLVLFHIWQKVRHLENSTFIPVSVTSLHSGTSYIIHLTNKKSLLDAATTIGVLWNDTS